MNGINETIAEYASTWERYQRLKDSYKYQTNKDRIQTMSIYELTEFIYDLIYKCECSDELTHHCEQCVYNSNGECVEWNGISHPCDNLTPEEEIREWLESVKTE